MDVESMYQEIILDHYRHPHGKGLRDPFEAQVHHVNPTCGDEVDLRVHLERVGPDVIIRDVSYDGQGCSISQASASVLYDQLVGRTVQDALHVQEEFTRLMQSRGSDVDIDEEALGDAVAFAGVSKYPARIKCALLSWMAWRDAVSSAMKEVPQ